MPPNLFLLVSILVASAVLLVAGLLVSILLVEGSFCAGLEEPRAVGEKREMGLRLELTAVRGFVGAERVAQATHAHLTQCTSPAHLGHRIAQQHRKRRGVTQHTGGDEPGYSVD